VERFLVKGQKRNGTARAASYISGTKRLLEMHVVPRWRGRKITDITTAHVATLLNAVADAGKPIAARRVHAALNVFFGWCIGQGTITANPAKPATRPGRETRRDRVLAPDELATIWPCMAALDQRERKTKVTYPTIGPFGQLLLATGQRRNEVARMKWSHVDMDKALWTIPAAETKAKREHAVPLSALALEILKRCDRGGEFVFESTTPRSKGETARSISGFGPIKRRLDKLVSAARKAAKLPEIAAWELHDLRRSAASLMRAELGLSSDTIGRVLNHAAQGVTEQHYLRLDPLAEKRRALDAWGSYLTAIVAPKDDARKVAYIAGRGQATAAVAAG
jgi:integrase